MSLLWRFDMLYQQIYLLAPEGGADRPMEVPYRPRGDPGREAEVLSALVREAEPYPVIVRP